MEHQQRKTADDEFHHNAIPQYKVVLFNKLDRHDEE